ncbi:TPA: hypothetical protein N8T39_000711 [Escherichia coli]|nr:hypothetical protein [Escherichia coli]
MTALNKEALRGQSVEGSYYLAECGHCGEMYPSNKLDGGEPLFSGDYGECFCHLCGADDSDIADNGAWGSEAVTAWNYQQKRIEALLDELESAEKRIAEHNFENRLLANADRDIKALRQRIAELEARDINIKRQAQALFEAIANPNDCYIPAYVRCLREALNGNSTGIGVKGE